MRMQRRMIAAVLALVCLVGCGSTGQADSRMDTGQLQVCVSFYTMQDFTEKIGGDRVQVTNLVPAGAEPHDWEPAGKDIAALERCSLLVLNGAGFEHWTDGVLPTLKNTDMMVVETAANLILPPELAGMENSGDPHVWLSPRLALQQMAVIRDGLIAADPEGESTYRQNYDSWAPKMEALDQRYRDTIAALPGKEIVVAHEAFGYLCAQYGLTQVAVQGLSPEGEPDPAQMAQVIAYAREHSVKVIFFEEQASPKVAETIAREIGATTAVLSPLEGLTSDQQKQGQDYFAVMEQNLQELKVALS